jgi:imidazolonepropionase-like amidohydrolase
MSVVARDGHIITVAPAADTLAPVNARVIEGAGKTLLPGLWDAHFHFIQDSLGVVALAHGITTARDLGNYPDSLPLRIARIERGELLGPRIVPLLLIDGPGPYRAQLGVLATDLKSGLKQVHRAKAEGYIGIKLYGSLDPKLVAPLAAEAHSLGLRVQGHIPATMRALDAVRAGYDEITHLNFTMMQAMPQLVVDRSNTSQRFLGIARYGGDVDWHTPTLSAFLDEMRDRHIAIDTTIAGYEAMYICDAGKLSAGLTPWAGVLPPDLERVSTPRTCQALPDATLDQMRAAFVKQEELISELHRRSVPIVAGTDGDMIRLVRDVELFHDSGFTPAEAIASATIVPARLSRLDGESGSIAQGKLADLILVDGDPGKRLDDLRKVDFVMRDDRLMRGDDLRSAAGFLGRPH